MQGLYIYGPCQFLTFPNGPELSYWWLKSTYNYNDGTLFILCVLHEESALLTKLPFKVVSFLFLFSKKLKYVHFFQFFFNNLSGKKGKGDKFHKKFNTANYIWGFHTIGFVCVYTYIYTCI